MYQKYLVTGADSQVGKYLINLLLEKECDVRILVKPDSDISAFEGLNIEIVEGELFDKDSTKEFFTVEDPRHSVLIHAEEKVSIVRSKDTKDIEMRRINMSGTQNMVDQCLKYKIGRVVYLSSAYALNPGSAMENLVLHFDRRQVEGEYAQSKAEASAYVMEKISLNKLNAVLLLPTFIISPDMDTDSDMKKVLEGYLENGVATIKGGRAFVDARDVAESLYALTEKGKAGSCYIIGGEYKSTDEFFAAVCEAKGIDQTVKNAPKWITSKSLSKVADSYYRIMHKDNPKEVYALFTDNPDAQFKSTIDDILDENNGTISFKDSISQIVKP